MIHIRSTSDRECEILYDVGIGARIDEKRKKRTYTTYLDSHGEELNQLC